MTPLLLGVGADDSRRLPVDWVWKLGPTATEAADRHLTAEVIVDCALTAGVGAHRMAPSRAIRRNSMMAAGRRRRRRLEVRWSFGEERPASHSPTAGVQCPRHLHSRCLRPAASCPPSSVGPVGAPSADSKRAPPGEGDHRRMHRGRDDRGGTPQTDTTKD